MVRGGGGVRNILGNLMGDQKLLLKIAKLTKLNSSPELLDIFG